jgi:Arc/MetJ family transcription regulator
MPTNLSIDDDLLRRAVRVGKHRTKREAVDQALREYVERYERKKILDLAGSLEWDAEYDYKADRAARR